MARRLISLPRMMNTIKRVFLLGIPVLLATVGFSTTSCDKADNFFDCQAVCDRYKSCFDSTYDVGTCRSRCRDKADSDDTFQKKADACEACIDDKSCSEATFKCATECAGVVPQ
jgi:hypothetical protein